VRYEFKTSFDRRFKKLPLTRQQKAFDAIDTLMNYFDGLTPLPKALGLKNWKGDYWEIRSTLKDRILFKFEDHIVFLFIGNHDEIRFLLTRMFHESVGRDREDGRATGKPQGVGSEAYLNGTSQGPTPEDAQKDGHIRGRSRRFVKYPG